MFSPPRSDDMAVRSQHPHFVHLAATAALALVLAGCGSSGGTAPAGTGNRGGAGGTGATGFTQGAITGFGTVHMGGGADEKVFHTEGAILKRLDDGIEHDGTGDDAVMF